MACDTDSIMVVASAKGKMAPGARRPLIEVEGNMNIEAIKPILSLSHDTVKKIASRLRSLNPYSFGGDLLKIEDINYVPDKNGKPTNALRTIHGFAISAKRYCLQEGKKIVEVKGHGLGYLMSPALKDNEDWMVDAWKYVLQVDGDSFISSEPDWLDYPAMMKIPVSSPAVLGRLKGFCKPYDFVRAPIIPTVTRTVIWPCRVKPKNPFSSHDSQSILRNGSTIRITTCVRERSAASR
jgi:hypothetical protein